MDVKGMTNEELVRRHDELIGSGVLDVTPDYDTEFISINTELLRRLDTTALEVRVLAEITMLASPTVKMGGIPVRMLTLDGAADAIHKVFAAMRESGADD